MSASAAADPSRVALRWGVYWILIALAVGSMLGRILAVDSVEDTGIQEYKIHSALNAKRAALQAEGLTGKDLESRIDDEEQTLREKIQLSRPFLSGNDRSRWCTLRALVEPELRVPGHPYAIDRVIALPRWDTIDMVMRDGHLYSSKPPLYSTLLAGGYWLLYHRAGLSLENDPYVVARILLVAFNVLPLAVYFVLVSRLAERFGRTDWGRIFVVACATLGTFLTTFAVVINNHLPAAVCAAATLTFAVRIWFDDSKRLRDFALAGLFAALTVTVELPAACLAAFLSLALLWKAPRQTLLALVPAAAVVAAAYFGTNWIAVRSLQPAYAHRNPGDNWYDYEYVRNGKTIPSYWRDPQGIDRGEGSRAVYALNVLVGHHGIFLLTPVWLLSVAGAGMWLWRPADPRLRQLALFLGAISLVVVGFYLKRPLLDRNYGGMNSGLRWVFWLAPFWLTLMQPAVDALAARPRVRWLALALLIVSVLSTTYPTWNPWTNPWAMDAMRFWGWIE